MPPDERDTDETQALSEPTDQTQAFSPPDEPTRALHDAEGPADATRRLTPPPTAHGQPTQHIGHDTVVSPAHPPSPRGTYATERIVLPQRASLAPWLIALVIVVALVVGAVLGYTQTRPSDNNVVARALVSPNGGVMKFDGPGRLTVPKGALSSPTAITIRRDTVDHPVRLGAEGDPRSVTYDAGELVVYAFEPSDLRFQQPVTIELPRRGKGSAVFVDVGGSPHVVPGQAKDDTVTIQTMSFSFTQGEETAP
jgi:hypothetical protein